jgi:hypothetical protein
MIIYKFRESDHAYVGPVEVPDAPFIPPFHTRTPPPEQEWHPAVLRIGWILVGGETPDEAPPPPPPPPNVVSMRQARLALLGAGLLDAVEAAIAAMEGVEGKAAQIEWEYATEVRRDSPLVDGLTAALGLTDAQLNDLFTVAATL